MGLKLQWLKDKEQIEMLERGYLEKGETPEQRFQAICDAIQKYSNKLAKTPEAKEILTLKNSMPTGICGYCYGNKILDTKETLKRYNQGKELKSRIPNLNCGSCGFKSCNEFIRAVLDEKVDENKCVYIKK